MRQDRVPDRPTPPTDPAPGKAAPTVGKLNSTWELWSPINPSVGRDSATSGLNHAGSFASWREDPPDRLTAGHRFYRSMQRDSRAMIGLPFSAITKAAPFRQPADRFRADDRNVLPRRSAAGNAGRSARVLRETWVCPTAVCWFGVSAVGPPNPQVYRPFCHHDSSSRSCSIAASSPALTSSSLPYGPSATL